MKNLQHVFSFTLSRAIKNRTWKATTLVIALILLILPAVVLPLLAEDRKETTAYSSTETAISSNSQSGVTGSDASGTVDTSDEFDTFDELDTSNVLDSSDVSAALPLTIYACDLTEGDALDFSILHEIFAEASAGAETQSPSFIATESAEEAIAAALEGENALVVLLTGEPGSYSFQILTPDDSDTAGEAASYAASLMEAHEEELLQAKAGVTSEQLQAWYAAQEEAVSSDDSYDPMSIFRMILIYLNVMVLYFLVLFYGKNTADSIVLEKSSKLMDTLLANVRPRVLLFGKVFGITAASILQLLIWVLCGCIGICSGLNLAVRLYGAEPAFVGILRIFLQSMPGAGIPAMILAILFIFAGFFLYSCLASIGGAAAGKQEDLGATNSFFTIILVASFLIVLQAGLNSSNSLLLTVLNWIPFTAIMLAPANIILGDMSLLSGTLSLGVTLVVSLLIILLAVKIYEAFVLYKGQVPTPAAIWKALRGRR